MGLFTRTRRSPLPLGKAAATGGRRAEADFRPQINDTPQAPRQAARPMMAPIEPLVPAPLVSTPLPPDVGARMTNLRDAPAPAVMPRIADRIKAQPERAEPEAVASVVAEAPPAAAAQNQSPASASAPESLRDRLAAILPAAEKPRPAPDTIATARKLAGRLPQPNPGKNSAPKSGDATSPGTGDVANYRGAETNPDTASAQRRSHRSPFRHMTSMAAGLINVIAFSALTAAALFAFETGDLPWVPRNEVVAGTRQPVLPRGPQASDPVTTAAIPPPRAPELPMPQVAPQGAPPAPLPAVPVPAAAAPTAVTATPPVLAPTLDRPPSSGPSPVIEASTPPALAAAPTVARPKALALETEHMALFDRLIAPARDTKFAVEDATRVRDATTALAQGNYAEVQRLRDGASDPMTKRFIGWHLLRSGVGTPREMKSFVEAFPDWPDRRLITQRMEEQLFIAGGSARELKSYFDRQEPQTGVGVAVLASAFLAEGDEAKARELVSRAWRTMSIPANLETGFMDRFGKLLTDADHKWRFDRLTIDDIRWPAERADRAAVARRMLARLSEDERRKAEARLAVFTRQVTGDPGAAVLPKPKAKATKADESAAPPKKPLTVKEQAAAQKATAELAKAAQARAEQIRLANAQAITQIFADREKIDWGLAYHRIQWLRRNKRLDESWQLLRLAPTETEKVVSPSEWWPERRLAAYDALKAGKAELAYELVKAPGTLGVNEQKDATFFAGWIALRHLNDPKRAEAHFLAFEKSTDGPLSRGKAAYWLARTYEALGQPDRVRPALEKATRNPDTFFGQLARMEIDPKSTLFEIKPPLKPTDAEAQAFNAHQSVLGAIMARRAGLDSAVVRTFLNHLRQTLETEPQQAMLAHLAEALGDTQFAVRIAKSAIARGQNLIYYGYPTHPMPAFKALRPPPEMALLLSVARQESEFNSITRSGAGAAGLMQVMPITARHICRDYKLTCEIDRLGRDPAYNAMMASAYIGDRMDEFSGSYILTLAGYNAGPGRTRQWIREFGDPRDPAVDPIDWIHRIPFEETREYVFKVMSNIQVYRARLGDEANALKIRDDVRRTAAPTGRRAQVLPLPPDQPEPDEPEAGTQPALTPAPGGAPDTVKE